MSKTDPTTPTPASKLPALFRSRDVEEFGVSRKHLAAMSEQGHVEKVSRGLYRRTDSPFNEMETVAAVSRRVPNSVVCLLTALHIHGIGTQAPRDVWIAIPRSARKPSIPDLPLRVVRFGDRFLTYAVQEKVILGTSVLITTPARTVVDCFRYRNKLGVDIALEALRDATRTHRATVTEIDRVAEMCRARTVVGPYLEALSA